MNAPYGVTVAPKEERISPEQRELRSERERFANDQNSIRNKRMQYVDKIGQEIGGRWYKANHSWWNIIWKRAPVSASRYYPEIQAAVDIFPIIGKDEKQEIDFKRRAFAHVGVRYGAISYSDDLAILKPQLGF